MKLSVLCVRHQSTAQMGKSEFYGQGNNGREDAHTGCYKKIQLLWTLDLKRFPMILPITVFHCLILSFLPLCCQGVIQDVKLIFAPNGYITQCPNLNRSKYHDDPLRSHSPTSQVGQWPYAPN